MSGPYDIFIAAGQSNMFCGYSDPQNYFDHVTDRVPGPHLYQYRSDGSVATATQGMDFSSYDAANLVSWSFYFCRDYYIPKALSAGRDVLIIPSAVGGAGFTGHWAVGGDAYETMVTQINGALAHDVGNTLKGMFWQHGEEDVSDAGAGIGNYATMSLTDGYNAYMTSMRSDLHSRITGGFNQVPIFVGGMIPDICWGPTTDVSAYSSNYPTGIGVSADGGDHHNTANVPMYALQKNMPAVLTNCAFVDSLNPTKLLAQSVSNPILNSTYWFHYSENSHRQMAHRAWKVYQKAALGVTPITLGW